MATLTTPEKRWIVEQLAVFETPQQVVDAFPEEFKGRSVTRQQVANYDGSKAWARTGMAAALRDLFDATRKRFRVETEDIAIANKAYRLRALDRLHREAKSPQVRMSALEQAAKESGDAYTNVHKHRVTGKDDETPVQTASVVVTMPDNGRGDRPVGEAARPGAPPAGLPG